MLWLPALYKAKEIEVQDEVERACEEREQRHREKSNDLADEQDTRSGYISVKSKYEVTSGRDN